jgi:aspartyl/asparaginyl beta-hydroxylase (cupin superfamily)
MFAPEDIPTLFQLLAEATERFGTSAMARVQQAFLIASGGQPRETNNSLQQPDLWFPGLTAKAWYEPSDYPDAVGELERNWEVIRDELVALCGGNGGFQGYRQERKVFYSSDEWKVCYFRFGSANVEDNRQLCPKTSAILDRIPRLAQLAMFSALRPGGHILPHCGTNNCKITLHLGLKVPRDCEMRVGSQSRTWTEGRCLLFDDSFEHEVWNRSNATRFVLLLDVWHAELTDAEVWILSEIVARVNPTQRDRELDRMMTERLHEERPTWETTGA